MSTSMRMPGTPTRFNVATAKPSCSKPWPSARAWLTALSVSLASLPGLLAGAQQVPPGPPLGGIAGPGDLPLKEPVEPLSAKLGVVLPQALPFAELGAPDMVQVLNEDAQDQTGRLREGVALPMKFDPGMGNLYRVPAGGWLWVLDVHAQGSFGVRLHFADFDLPDSAEAIVYDPQITNNLPSPYTLKGLLGTGEFWAWTSWSDTARVEVYYPEAIAAERFVKHFDIDQAAYMYRNPQTGQVGAYGARELGCYNDLACYPNWVNSGAAVGLMSFMLNGSSYGCTGSMLNNNAGDLTPYFMTAHHCMQDNGGALASLSVYWFYQEPTCGGAVPSLGSVPRSDVSSYLRSDLGVDMSLVMIEGTVPRTLWWAGNDSASQPENTSVVGIHHPRGTRKRISFGTENGYSVSCGATGLTQGFNTEYSSGTVEPGSSGSPLYLTNGAFIGTLSCGPVPAQCPGPGPEGIYGSWFVGYGSFANYVYYAGSDDGYENNDTCATATNLNGFYNGTLYSLIVKSVDPDWYHISVPAFGDVSFQAHFTHANGDIDMQLHDGCGGVLATSQSTTDNETITWHNSSSAAHEVYLNVYLYNDTRNIYYLDFSRSAPAAPFNDACSSAAALDLGSPGVPQNGRVYGRTIGATTDGSTSCATTGPDVWHRLTVPCTRTVTLDTYGSDFDTVLSVHTGCPGTAANQVACNDDNQSDTESLLSYTFVGGQNYYVRISGYHGAAGNYQLNWTQTMASDDLCANSIDLPPGTYQFNNCPCDTDGPPDDTCLAFGSNQIYHDFWIGYTPPCYGTIELNTFAPTGPHLDTKIAVYANPDNSTCPLGPNSAIVCNDDANAFYESQVIFSCIAGQHYIFRIGSYADTGGVGVLHLIYTPGTPCTPPTGACCAAGACAVISQADCLNQGGTYFGDDTDCADPDLCTPPVIGACCIADQCSLASQADCANQGGIYFGDGTDCTDPDLCYAPTGACCTAGVCEILPELACENQGGAYFGDDTDCQDPDLCTPPSGACCTINQCNVLSQADCDAAGGSWQGPGTTCDTAASCPPHCGSADFNCDGDIGTDSDIAAYFACLAGNCPPLPCISNLDFNGDGDLGTDADIESFFRVLAGGAC